MFYPLSSKENNLVNAHVQIGLRGKYQTSMCSVFLYYRLVSQHNLWFCISHFVNLFEYEMFLLHSKLEKTLNKKVEEKKRTDSVLNDYGHLAHCFKGVISSMLTKEFAHHANRQNKNVPKDREHKKDKNSEAGLFLDSKLQPSVIACRS